MQPNNNGTPGKVNHRQLPVKPDHHRHNRQEGKEVAENGDDAGREQVVQHIHVGGDTRHHAAHRVAVVETQLQALQVAENLLAQVVHDFLSHQLHGERLDKLQDKGQKDRRQENDQADLENAGERIVTEEAREEFGNLGAGRRVQVAVHFHLRQVGWNRLQEAEKQNRGQRKQRYSSVRQEIPQQALHQPRVIGLAENFFFVVTVGHI